MSLSPRMNMAAYTVTRSQIVAPVNGRPSAPSTSTFPIQANMQPADGDTLKTMPEARDSDDVRKLFTATLLFVTSNTYLPDIVSIGGQRFEVIKVAGWPGHYEVIVQKVDRP